MLNEPTSPAERVAQRLAKFREMARHACNPPETLIAYLDDVPWLLDRLEKAEAEIEWLEDPLRTIGGRP